MSTIPHSLSGKAVQRLFFLFAVCLFLIPLSACVRGGAKGGEPPANPNEKKMAYGLAMTMPPAWAVLNTLSPEAVTKEALDARRKGGERIVLLEANGAPGPRNFQPFITATLVNEEGNFIPREYAEKLSPQELDVMAKDMMKRERAQARKNRTKNNLLEMTFTRETIGGKLALMQRLTVAGPDGKPIRLLGWDIYLPNGAGIMIRSGCDLELPGAAGEVIGIVKTLRVQ